MSSSVAVTTGATEFEGFEGETGVPVTGGEGGCVSWVGMDTVDVRAANEKDGDEDAVGEEFV